MSEANQQNYAQQEVLQSEQNATDTVAYSDQIVAQQATGYDAQTPEQAEAIARQAVEASDNMVVQQIYGNQPQEQSVEAAEQEATAAVMATE